MAPSTSKQPSMEPSVSSEPSLDPSQFPSEVPTLTTQPSISPSLSILPSEHPSIEPSLTKQPSIAPSVSAVPSVSLMPTGEPTFRKEFGSAFQNADIGPVTTPGTSSNIGVGLYSVSGSGGDIWSTSDGFHFLFVESSGDATFTAMVEDFGGNPLDPWASKFFRHL